MALVDNPADLTPDEGIPTTSPGLDADKAIEHLRALGLRTLYMALNACSKEIKKQVDKPFAKASYTLQTFAKLAELAFRVTGDLKGAEKGAPKVSSGKEEAIDDLVKNFAKSAARKGIQLPAPSSLGNPGGEA